MGAAVTFCVKDGSWDLEDGQQKQTNNNNNKNRLHFHLLSHISLLRAASHPPYSLPPLFFYHFLISFLPPPPSFVFVAYLFICFFMPSSSSPTFLDSFLSPSLPPFVFWCSLIHLLCKFAKCLCLPHLLLLSLIPSCLPPSSFPFLPSFLHACLSVCLPSFLLSLPLCFVACLFILLLSFIPSCLPPSLKL